MIHALWIAQGLLALIFLFAGGMKLVLPLEVLTPLAAAGLVIIMIGATVLTLAGGDVALALIPLLVGLLSAFVDAARSYRSASSGDAAFCTSCFSAS